jgi:hypothetical protein
MELGAKLKLGRSCLDAQPSPSGAVAGCHQSPRRFREGLSIPRLEIDARGSRRRSEAVVRQSPTETMVSRRDEMRIGRLAASTKAQAVKSQLHRGGSTERVDGRRSAGVAVAAFAAGAASIPRRYDHRYIPIYKRAGHSGPRFHAGCARGPKIAWISERFRPASRTYPSSHG